MHVHLHHLLVLPRIWHELHLHLCKAITIVTANITDREILSELFPASLDQIITRKYSNRINLISFGPITTIHRSDDTRTEAP